MWKTAPLGIRPRFGPTRTSLYIALAALIVVGSVVGYLVYRHDVEALQADLARLLHISSQLSSHDKTSDRYAVASVGIEKHAIAAAQRRHDSAISANNNPVFETRQADIEKADVAKLDTIITKVRGEHAAKVALLSSLYGDDAVAPYRDCEASYDEDLGDYVDNWTNAIDEIDDDDHLIINGAESSPSVDTQSGNFYAASAKSLEAVISQGVKCAAAHDALMRRLKGDIQVKEQKLASLGVRSH